MDEMPYGPTLTAGSWEVAARIVSANPALRIYETHPAGGTYDCLSVGGPNVHIDINRAGSIHVHRSPGGEKIGLIPAQEWTTALLTKGTAQRIADQVVEFCRIAVDQPGVTPWLLTYRVIARTLASRVFDSTGWDARQQFEDTSGYSIGIRWPVPSPEMGMIPANLMWVLLRGEQRIAWLWDGWAWTARGERLNLIAAYNSGARIDDLVAAVTARATKAGAPALPEMPRYPEDQPIDEWWKHSQ